MSFLGGSATQKTQIPAWLEEAGKSLLDRAMQVSNIGYVPYQGPDVAAFAPAQMAAFQGTNQAASAFGLPTAQMSMPAAQDYGGIQAYSAFPMYQAAIEQLKASNPEIYAALTQRAAAQPAEQPTAPQPAQPVRTNTNPSYRQPAPIPVPGQSSGGYTSLRDMFDGGGPGASGDTFQGGGLLSDWANWRGFRPLGGN